MVNAYRTPTGSQRRHFPGQRQEQPFTSWWIPPHGAQKEREVATPAQVQVKNGATGVVQGSPYPVASEVSRASATPPWVRWGVRKPTRCKPDILKLSNEALLTLLRRKSRHKTTNGRQLRAVAEAKRVCPLLPLKGRGQVGSRQATRHVLVRAWGVGVRRLRQLERWCIEQRKLRVEKRTRQAS
jgi:hypothetical protein